MEPAFKASCSWKSVGTTTGDISERIHFLQTNDDIQPIYTFTPPLRFSASTQSSAPNILISFDSSVAISGYTIHCNAKTVELYPDNEYLLTERALEVPSDSAMSIAETIWTINGKLGQGTQFVKSLMLKFFSLPKGRNDQGKRVTADFLLHSINIKLSSTPSQSSNAAASAFSAELSNAEIDASTKPFVDMGALLSGLQGLHVTGKTPADIAEFVNSTDNTVMPPYLMQYMQLKQASYDSTKSDLLPDMPTLAPTPQPPPPTESPPNTVHLESSLDVPSLLSRLERLEQTVTRLAANAEQTSFPKAMIEPSGQPPPYLMNVTLATAEQSQTTVVDRLERLENRLQKVTQNFDQKLDLLARSMAAITTHLELVSTGPKRQGIINGKD